jgi:hypothetical protein
MIKTLDKIKISVITLALFMPFSTSAAPLVNCDGPDTCTFSKLIELINTSIEFIIVTALSISAIMISYAGFLYLTAGGDLGKVKKAHTVLRMTIMGIIIIMLAWLIVSLLYNVLGVGGDYSPFGSS